MTSVGFFLGFIIMAAAVGIPIFIGAMVESIPVMIVLLVISFTLINVLT